MQTDLDIINAACARVGINALGEEGLDEDSDEGQAASLAYVDTVDFNLGIYMFSFAKEIRQLSVDDTATPLTGFTYVYDLPAERLGAPLYVTDDVTNPKRRFERYVLIGDQLHTDASPVFAQIRFRPSPRFWSPAFRSATVSALAANFALAIREDRGLHADLHRQAYGTASEGYRGGQLGAAIAADAFSTPIRTPNWNNNPFERAWRGDDTGSEE